MFNGKRQRRQAAGAVVGSLWGGGNTHTNTGRKSTAQPRPKLNVPPKGIGPIRDPNENDVLCGRGGRINSHSGNIKFRDIINAKKKEYLAPTTKKLEKAHIAAAIVNSIRSMDPPGRFLKEERSTGLWYDIGDAKAIKKTGQALREDAPDIRNEIDEDSSGDEKSPKKDPSKAKDDKDTRVSSTTPKPPEPQQTQISDGSRTPVSSNPAQSTEVQSTTVAKPPPQFPAPVGMPPPYTYHSNPYIQQPQYAAQQFEGRTIPLQSPLPQSIYSASNCNVAVPVSMNRHPVGRRGGTNTSRHAMDALAQQPSDWTENWNQPVPADNVAFGRQFYEPPDASALSGGGNTMSTISGISDTLSSTFGASALMSDVGKDSVISGMSAVSGLSAGIESTRTGTRRNNNRAGLGASGMSRSSRQNFLDAMRNSNNTRMNDTTMPVYNFGSVGRAYNSDNLVANANMMDDVTAWQSITEEAPMATTSHEENSIDHTFSAPRYQYQRRDSTAMSSAMSVASGTMSVLSEMSAEMQALDLAAPHY